MTGRTRAISTTCKRCNSDKLLPFAGVTFVLAGVASMGLPGFSGFVAELQVLMGAWKVFPAAAILSGLGIIVGVAYTLRAMQKAFYSDTAVPDKSGPDHPLEPITMPERIGAVMLIAASLSHRTFPRSSSELDPTVLELAVV